MSKKWHWIDNSGDGTGTFWRQDHPGDDYVEAVRIEACSQAGGPDNLYCVEIGSIYFGNAERQAMALNACGEAGQHVGHFAVYGPKHAPVHRRFDSEFEAKLFLATRGGALKEYRQVYAPIPELVEAVLNYEGIECRRTEIVRVGPVDKVWLEDRMNVSSWNPEPTRIIRSNASINRYVRRELCW